MGLFKKRAADPAEIERLKAEIASMSARLEAADQRMEDAQHRLDAADRRLADSDTEKTQLGEQVRGIVTRLDTPIGSPPSEPPPPPPTTFDPAELAAVSARLDQIAERLDSVDTRITSISTELANQIDELGADIDAAGNRTPPADAVVEQLREAQERLANEQARYQIAFRHDLAHLADRLKRS